MCSSGSEMKILLIIFHAFVDLLTLYFRPDARRIACSIFNLDSLTALFIRLVVGRPFFRLLIELFWAARIVILCEKGKLTENLLSDLVTAGLLLKRL